MKVRSANVLDLGRIEELHRQTGAMLSEQPPSVRLWSLFSHSLSALLPLSQETLIYVAEERGRVVGFVQASSSGPTINLQAGTTMLQVLNLCVADGSDPDAVVPSLLEHLAMHAVGRGVHRLLVRVPLDDPLLRVIRREGFRQYATEHVYFAEQPAPAAPVVPAGTRPVRGRDDRPVYQLYRKVTPMGVSMVEAPTFKEWKMLRAQGGGQQLVVDRVELVAWARVARSTEPARPHTLSFLALPESGLAEELVDHVLGLAGEGAAWASLRHYDAQIIDALRARAFTNLLTQALLVQELAVRVPVREKGLVPSFG